MKSPIFDLDGTLLNTLADLRISTNAALAQHGMPPRSEEEIRQFVGNGVAMLIQRAVPDGTSAEETDKVLDTFQQHYLKHSLDTTHPYDGILPMLAECRRRGLPTAIVSNKLDAAVQRLATHFFPGLVATAVGEQPSVRRKPAPDMLFEALRRLHLTPDEAVYVGDSETDILTARNAGLPCISVTWGFRTHDLLTQAGATVLIDRPDQLFQHL